MEMVATTKLRRFQERAVASRPYALEVRGMLTRLAAMLGDDLKDRPLFGKSAGKRTLLLLVTSDRGLCGAYNSSVFRTLELWLRDHPGKEVDYYVYGRKGFQYLTRRGREVKRLFVEPLLEQIDYRAAARLARAGSQAYQSGEYAEVVVLYTAFESVVRYVPKLSPLLPIDPKELQGDAGAKTTAGDVLLEPDAATIFDRLVPRYLETRIYNALLESLTSEYASRRVSM